VRVGRESTVLSLHAFRKQIDLQLLEDDAGARASERGCAGEAVHVLLRTVDEALVEDMIEKSRGRDATADS
jgi:hypothetical protein